MRPHETDNAAGFTLVEMMAVLFVISVMTGLVVLNLPSRTAAAQSPARQLAVELNRASDAALLEGASRALALSEESWSLNVFNDAAWQEVTSAPLPRDAVLVIDELRVELTDESVPHILFDATGLATPFELTLGQGRDRETLIGDASGDVRVESDRAR